jgi:hypothetical protein
LSVSTARACSPRPPRREAFCLLLLPLRWHRWLHLLQQPQVRPSLLPHGVQIRPSTLRFGIPRRGIELTITLLLEARRCGPGRGDNLAAAPMVEGAVPVGEAVECRGRRGGSRGRCMELVVDGGGRIKVGGQRRRRLRARRRMASDFEEWLLVMWNRRWLVRFSPRQRRWRHAHPRHDRARA